MSGKQIAYWKHAGRDCYTGGMAQYDETKIQNAILVAHSQAGALTWRNHCGAFRAMDNPQRIIKVGTPGMADIISVVPVKITADMVGKTIGVAVATEVKTATGAQGQKQKLWQHAYQLRGGIYLIARSAEQALEQIASLPGRILRS